MLSKIQQHTINIYSLSQKEYSIKKVKARTLLTPFRFDLFVKLYYIANKEINYNKALSIYTDHIKAFNPDCKEPGREDKTCLNDFVNTFDCLIADFRNGEFNDDTSIIPVDTNGIILDGAHRVAALAYYDKEVTIAQFKNTFSKGHFNYLYFKERGMKWDNIRIVSEEMVKWQKNILVACIWPKVGNQKEIIINKISNNYNITFIHSEKIKLNPFTKFIYEIYKSQEWTKNPTSVSDKAINCFKYGISTTFVFFEAGDNINSVISLKEEIRDLYNYGKHSIHITDNHEETIEISQLLFNQKHRYLWDNHNNLNLSKKIRDYIAERIYYFKKVHLLNFKIFIAKLLCKK